MNKILKYTLCVLGFAALVACTQDKVTYDFGENPGPAVTFASAKLKLPGLTAENNGKLEIPLYRGNVNGAASVDVQLEGAEGLCELASTKVEFADGQNVANAVLTFDFETLTPKPANLTLSVVNEADLAIDGVQSTTFTFVKQLTYELVGEGVHYSVFWHAYFGDMAAGIWPQDLYKAKEGNYFLLKDCWSAGTDFSFYCDGTEVDWYTEDTGTSYGSYGNIFLYYTGATVAKNDAGQYELTLDVPAYYLPDYYDYALVEGGSEVFTFPEGFEFN